MSYRTVGLALGILTLLLPDRFAPAVELVKDGRPVATVVSDAKPIQQPAGERKRRRATSAAGDGEALATRLLVDWVGKMTGA